MTIISSACAQRCNYMPLLDKRFAGVAKGVGTQKILGRIHLGQIQIGDRQITQNFSVVEDQPMDLLIGLDMLKRHHCVIDLKVKFLKNYGNSRFLRMTRSQLVPSIKQFNSSQKVN